MPNGSVSSYSRNVGDSRQEGAIHLEDWIYDTVISDNWISHSVGAAVNLRNFADGNVSDARIVRSSGYDDFDRATLREARSWRMLPAMRGEEPFAQWHRLRVVFKLKGQ